ncbi:MAG: hypothetical protein ACU0CA_04605 [Paracoccaceae bacterium]
MSFDANTVRQLVKSEAPVGAISISETFWGYIIRKGGRAANRAAAGEIVAMMASLMFGVAAYSQWLLPGTINNVEVFPFKIAGTIVFFVFAFLNYSIARKGLMYETQVDEKRQVIRMARRNRDGVSTLLGSFEFADIERIYTARSQSTFVPDRLYIKPTASKRAILIAMGPAGDLEPLRERMIAGMRPGGVQQRFAVTPKRVASKPSAVRGAFAAQ